ncbi:hypothetical protein L208DRAFT_1437869 [Tricholoma matsutake]|nr:hypothetical protein L208DRAFT_1437869 [Tricholoma matsutake 945]
MPKVIIIILFILPFAFATTNFQTCLKEIQNGTWGSVGGTDSLGRPVSDISTATGITYDLCLRACGAAPEPFSWTVFSQQFSSWLLPWLALISQLPFGANDKFDNLVSALITVGSPTLAAYSLALTILNGRWIARRFAAINYPNTRYAAQVLSSLQQSPLKVITSGSLLTSLVVLPENDKWWRELVRLLDFTHTWSVSAVASTAWVIIAYCLTLIDSFTGDPTASIQSTGQGIGSLWLWLLTIVLGWLQLSPKCDSLRLRQAIERANKIAYVATESGKLVLASSVSVKHGISLSLTSDDPLLFDEQSTAPIYNYARFLPWTRAVEDVCGVFRTASNHACSHRFVDPLVDWETTEESFKLNRMDTLKEVDASFLPVGEPTASRGSPWIHDIWSRFLVASMLALSLQWGTSGSGILVAYFTPTTGLGCRSGTYILYGALSTISWMILVLSSFLSYYSTTASPRSTSALFARHLSIILRRLGKIIASVNAIWIVISCLFQFSNFYDRCYCNSCVLSKGASAFNVITLGPRDIEVMKGAWIGGACLAAGCAITYVVFVNLFINPQLPV